MGYHSGCEHEFAYLLKKHEGGNLTGRVLQIPAVIAEGDTKDEVEAEIRKATRAWGSSSKSIRLRLQARWSQSSKRRKTAWF